MKFLGVIAALLPLALAQFDDHCPHMAVGTLPHRTCFTTCASVAALIDNISVICMGYPEGTCNCDLPPVCQSPGASVLPARPLKHCQHLPEGDIVRKACEMQCQVVVDQILGLPAKCKDFPGGTCQCDLVEECPDRVTKRESVEYRTRHARNIAKE